MKRCPWCHRTIWPWQRSRRYERSISDKGIWLHLRCLKAIYQMTLRDEEEVRSV